MPRTRTTRLRSVGAGRRARIEGAASVEAQHVLDSILVSHAGSRPPASAGLAYVLAAPIAINSQVINIEPTEADTAHN